MRNYSLFNSQRQVCSRFGSEIGSVADWPVERADEELSENDLFACEAALQAGWRDQAIENRREVAR